MSHGINKPIDIILSTNSTEWHGLADVVPVIDNETASPLLFPVIESPCFIQHNGNNIELPEYKVLAADLSARIDLPEDQRVIPLHIPKAGYKVITNRNVWDAMKAGLKDVDAKISSIGTLEAGKKFFISTDIGDSDMVINNDKFKFYLNFVTSHDGTIAMSTFDSSVRIVCMNTLRSSMNAAGDVGFKIYHTQNANLQMNNLPELIQAVLLGRTEMKNTMEYLASIECDGQKAIALAMGYFAQSTGDTKLSTRSKNAANELATLFSRGIGNNGKSLYDLANGATQYWTSGEGTGKKNTDVETRAYKSEMGTAAEHKIKFVQMLALDNERNEALELGAQSLAIKD